VSRTDAASAWTRAHPLVADAALAVALLIAALVSSHVTIQVNQAANPTYRPPGRAAVVAGMAATFVPLTARRRLPLVALLACVVGFVAARVVFDSIEASISVLALAVALYSAAAYGRRGWQAAACAASLVLLFAELWREVVVGAPPIKNVLVFQAFTLLLTWP